MIDYKLKIFYLKIIAIAVFLFGISFIAYTDALKGGLVWDANSYLIGNPYIQKLNWENLKWMFSTFFLSNWHPLTWLSYAFDYWIYGAIWGVALTNIILHGANTVLFFVLAVALINTCHHKVALFESANNKDLTAAFFAALLFCIHPQHVESVAWLAERKDVLCLFFVLLTFIFYMAYARLKAGNRRPIYYCIMLIFFIMALLSKPMAVTVPFLMILMDFYPLERVFLRKGGENDLTISWSLIIKKSVFEKIPLILFSSTLMVITIFAQEAAINPLEKFGLHIRLLNAVKSCFFYISKMLFPINLLPMYNDFPKIDDLTNFIYVGGFIIINILFIYLWYKNYRYWLISWIFYLTALMPVIGLVKVGAQSLADRYAYLPTIPFYILIGVGFSALLFRMRYLIMRIVILSSMVGLCWVLLILTRNQIMVWENELSLWGYILKILPNHGPANTGIGNYYFNKGNYKKAISHYQKAGVSGELIAYSMPAWAVSHIKLDELNKALLIYKAILENKIDVGISNSCIYYNIGLIYAKQGFLDYAKQSLALVKPDGSQEFGNAYRMLLNIEDIKNISQSEERINIFSNYQYCEKFYNPVAALNFGNGSIR